MESDKSEEEKKETTEKSTDETAETKEITETTETKEKLNDDQKSFLKFLGIAAIVLIAVMAFRFYGAGANNYSSLNGNAAATNSGEVQIVKMHVEGGQYILEPSSFKIGVPVRIEADMSRTPGCSKSIVISAFGIRKSLSAGNNIIEFTPTKAGTFNIACSMNMYRGTFVVLEASGAESNYIEAPSSGGGCGGGCGGGGGGGCGG